VFTYIHAGLQEMFIEMLIVILKQVIFSV